MSAEAITSPPVLRPPSSAILELRDIPRTPLRETLRRGSRLVSSKVGLIKSLTAGIHRAQDPELISLGVSPMEFARFSIVDPNAKCGGGGETKEQALAASIGEAVERYCMYFYNKAEMILARYKDVAEYALAPDDVRLYTQEQVDQFRADDPKSAFTYFTDETPICWVWGYSLTHRKPRLIPAGLVYLNYRISRDEGEVAIGRNASTGLAAAASREEAILSGLLEVIERDSFMITWQHRKLPRKLIIDDPELIELMERRLHANHPDVSIELYDTTLDIPVHAALIILRRPSEFGPTLCVGSASRMRMNDAVRKCLYEAGQALPFFRYIVGQDPDWKPEANFSNLSQFNDHSRLYIHCPELIPQAFSHCDEVTEEVALSDLPDPSTGRVLGDLDYCVDALAEKGHEVVVVDITTPDVRQVDLDVVRVVISGMVPLHGNHNRPFLGPKRLYEVPVRLGWKEAGSAAVHELTPYPHPFP